MLHELLQTSNSTGVRHLDVEGCVFIKDCPAGALDECLATEWKRLWPALIKWLGLNQNSVPTEEYAKTYEIFRAAVQDMIAAGTPLDGGTIYYAIGGGDDIEWSSPDDGYNAALLISSELRAAYEYLEEVKDPGPSDVVRLLQKWGKEFWNIAFATLVKKTGPPPEESILVPFKRELVSSFVPEYSAGTQATIDTQPGGDETAKKADRKRSKRATKAGKKSRKKAAKKKTKRARNT
jgi:hypothetical protein